MKIQTEPPTAEDVERSFGVTPLSIIDAKLEDSNMTWAMGSALFGPGGFANDERKSCLSVTAGFIDQEWDDARDGKKTEAAIDRKAHADPRYTEFLHKLQKDRAEWEYLTTQRNSWIGKKRRGDAIIYACGRGL